MKNNEKGIALVVTLILGVIALAFIGALLYFLTSGTKISGTEKRYYTALEAAKGGADLIIADILEDGDITCNNNQTCTPCPGTVSDDCKIDLSLTDNKLGDYTIEAYLRSVEATPTAKIFDITVISKNSNNPKEKAEVEFVYKIE